MLPDLVNHLQTGRWTEQSDLSNPLVDRFVGEAISECHAPKNAGDIGALLRLASLLGDIFRLLQLLAKFRDRERAVDLGNTFSKGGNFCGQWWQGRAWGRDGNRLGTNA